MFLLGELMIVEFRQYRIKAGFLAKYMDLYRENGYSIQTTYLGEPMGYYTPVTGDQNTVVHIWAYENYDDRATRRAKLFQDKKWLEFIEQVVPLIEEMNSIFKSPVSFSKT